MYVYRSRSVDTIECEKVRAEWGSGLHQLFLSEANGEIGQDEFWELQWTVNFTELRDVIRAWHKVFVSLLSPLSSFLSSVCIYVCLYICVLSI